MTATAGALFGIGLNGVNPDSVRLFTLSAASRSS